MSAAFLRLTAPFSGILRVFTGQKVQRHRRTSICQRAAVEEFGNGVIYGRRFEHSRYDCGQEALLYGFIPVYSALMTKSTGTSWDSTSKKSNS